MAKKKKFYKKKKQGVKELPNNSRTITEKYINDHTVFFLAFLGLFFAILVVSFDFYNNLQFQNKVAIEREQVIESLNFWNREVVSKPNYRDGYFSLSLIYYQLGDFYNSNENLDKAFEIDPNFERGVELQNLLEEKN